MTLAKLPVFLFSFTFNMTVHKTGATQAVPEAYPVQKGCMCNAHQTGGALMVEVGLFWSIYAWARAQYYRYIAREAYIGARNN